MAARITLGAPGVYQEPATPVHALDRRADGRRGLRRDRPARPGSGPVVDERHPPVRGMVGARRPRTRSIAVPVQSWDDYRRVFGGSKVRAGLPWTVAAFFAQGGRRAWVVRVVHDYSAGPGEREGVASGALAGVSAPGLAAVALEARSEGSWGNALRATLSFSTVPLHGTLAAGTSELTLPAHGDVPAGALLRLAVAGWP